MSLAYMLSNCLLNHPASFHKKLFSIKSAFALWFRPPNGKSFLQFLWPISSTQSRIMTWIPFFQEWQHRFKILDVWAYWDQSLRPSAEWGGIMSSKIFISKPLQAQEGNWQGAISECHKNTGVFAGRFWAWLQGCQYGPKCHNWKPAGGFACLPDVDDESIGQTYPKQGQAPTLLQKLAITLGQEWCEWKPCCSWIDAIHYIGILKWIWD